MKDIITFGTLLFFSLLTLQAEDEVSVTIISSYTSIDQKDCISLDSDNMGSIQECESFSNIRVKVIEGDIRQSIILIRNEKEYDLEFCSTVNPIFSSLGLKIEWRHEDNESEKIKGMIVRVESSSENDEVDTVSSSLVVSKITKDDICVVAKVLSQENQNQIAKDILEIKEHLPCLKNLENKTK